MNKRLHIAGWATILGFPLLGVLVLYLFGEPVAATMFRGSYNVVLQLGIGAALGTLLGMGAKWIITRPVLISVSTHYSKLIQGLRLKSHHVYLLSFCAGFGEELLFRGAIQPLAGIWITAIIFVAIHGYLNPMNWRISIYGIYMTLAIALLGYLTEWVGIFAACAAHMAIDVVLFNFLIAFAKKPASNYAPIAHPAHDDAPTPHTAQNPADTATAQGPAAHDDPLADEHPDASRA